MPSPRGAAVLCLSFVSTAMGLAAENQPWDLRAFVNADLTTYARGTAYPARGGVIHIAGIPFLLTPDLGDQHTSIIQIFSDILGNTVKRLGAANGLPPRIDSEITIPIERLDVYAVYVLMNSAFGSCGAVIGELEFIGNSQSYHYRLREGINIRDHNNGTFCNTVTTTAGIANYGNVRLDMQRISLPDSFSRHLESITIRGFRQRPQSGLPFLAAITLTIDRPDPVTDVTSSIQFASVNDCLPDPRTPICTPSHATVVSIGPNDFHIIVPANLRDAADIPNPRNRPVSVSGVKGDVCWQVDRPFPSGCTDPSGKPGVAGVIDASRPAGALVIRNANGRTYFSVNGLAKDLVPNGARAQKFDRYEGSLEFEVRIE